MNQKNVVKNLIWIEPKIEKEEEYDEYLQRVKSVVKYKLFTYTKPEGGINEINKVKFEDTTIIVSGNILDKFFVLLAQNLKKLYIIPKILVFSESKKIDEIKKNLKKYEHCPFFNQNYLFDSFNLVEKELEIDETLKYFSRNEKFIFDNVSSKEDLYLPMNFHKLITQPTAIEMKRFNNFLHEKYKESTIDYLLSQTITPKVPLELVIKYWLRLYSFEEFSKDLNNDLRGEIGNNYDVYVKLIYFGLKNNYIESCLNQNFYRGGIMNKREIDNIKKYLKNKKDDLPGCTCYSKVFMTFTLDKKIGLELMKLNKNELKKDESLVLFEIEKGDNKFDGKNATNANIQDISYYTERKEVLFFPFSCFEVNEVKDETKNNYSHIKLKYLGKYFDKIPQKIEEIKDIPSNNFTKSFVNSKISDKNEIKKLENKNPNLISSFIICDYKIEKGDLKKKIQIINCDEKNKVDIENNVEIFINNQKLSKGTLVSEFTKEGNYSCKIVFKKNLTNLSSLFSQCINLISIDLKEFKTNDVVNLSKMFFECKLLKEIDLSNLEGNKINDVSFMFEGCINLQKVNMKNFNSLEKSINFNHLFYKCSNLIEIDFSKFKILGNCTMDKTFEGVNLIKCKLICDDGALNGGYTYAKSKKK